METSGTTSPHTFIQEEEREKGTPTHTYPKQVTKPIKESPKKQDAQQEKDERHKREDQGQTTEEQEATKMLQELSNSIEDSVPTMPTSEQ